MASRSYRTLRFKEMFRALPPEVQTAARKACRRWLADPRHPSLHYKPIRDDIWSIRITRDYRALAVLRGGDVYWQWIGPHSEYDRRLARG